MDLAGVRRAGAAGVAVLALWAPVASGAPHAVGGSFWAIAIGGGRHQLDSQLVDNCTPLRSENLWDDGHGKKPYRLTDLYGGASADAGSYDFATGRGSLVGKVGGLRADSYASRSRGVRFLDPGLDFAPGKVTMTGHVVRGRSSYSRALSRTALARINHPKLLSGPVQDRKGRPVANTFVLAVQGTARLLPGMARELERIRCRGATQHGAPGRDNRPVRAGQTLGLLTVQLFGSAATGLGGTLGFVEGGLGLSDDKGPIAVTPTGGAVAGHDLDGPTLRFPLPAGQRTPLDCGLGRDCQPAAGAAAPLTGGFTLTQDGAALAVSGLSVAYGTVRGLVQATVSGVVGEGPPIALFSGPQGGVADPAPEYLTRVGQALGGRDVFGSAGALSAQFTRTGPPD